MNEIGLTLLGTQVADLQSGLRQVRIAIGTLNSRMDGLERRMGRLAGQIEDLSFKIDNLKGYIDVRFDAINTRFDALETLIREALRK